MWQTLRWPKWSHPGTAKPGRRSYIACTRSTEMVKSSDPTQHITSIASMDIYGTSAGKALFYHALSDLQLCPEFYLHRTIAAHLQVTALRAFIMYDLIPNVSHKIKPDKGGTKARTLLARSGRVSTQEKINKGSHFRPRICKCFSRKLLMQTSQPRMPQVIDSVACATTMLFGNGRQWTLEELYTCLDLEKVQVMQIQFQKTSLVEDMFHQSGSQISVSNQGGPWITFERKLLAFPSFQCQF